LIVMPQQAPNCRSAWCLNDENVAMSDVTKIPGIDDSIVMTDIFERDVKGLEANLFRVDGDATVIWRASPPGPSRGLTVSHLVRELLAEAVSQRATVAKLDGRALAERLAADVAEVRRRLAG
jgi:predicted RNA-binding protein